VDPDAGWLLLCSVLVAVRLLPKLYKIEYFMLLIYSEALFLGRCAILKMESFLHVAAVFLRFRIFMDEMGF